jgi:hypothetical protein
MRPGEEAHETRLMAPRRRSGAREGGGPSRTELGGGRGLFSGEQPRGAVGAGRPNQKPRRREPRGLVISGDEAKLRSAQASRHESAPEFDNKKGRPGVFRRPLSRPAFIPGSRISSSGFRREPALFLKQGALIPRPTLSVPLGRIPDPPCKGPCCSEQGIHKQATAAAREFPAGASSKRADSERFPVNPQISGNRDKADRFEAGCWHHHPIQRRHRLLCRRENAVRHEGLG